ncbi:hypothetical protein [Kitasatospora sp. MBT66]|uniref:hypothetical protein n=1 Tax=Kitasatospora sp. MBT66 TaxID=1444769 RepID=UPI0013147BEB|nr:hypothetical protein [Kitasatospora sp. MBT66]
MARVVRKIEIQSGPLRFDDDIPLSVLEKFVEEIREIAGMGVDPMVNVPPNVYFEYTEE